MRSTVPLVWSRVTLAVGSLLFASSLLAHPLAFRSVITYSEGVTEGGSAAIANLAGAKSAAENVGGGRTNAEGGSHSGAPNDDLTTVGSGRPLQGETFTTGDAPEGYDLRAITVRMAGYTSNVATGSNEVSWDLGVKTGPILVHIGRIDGSGFQPVSYQAFMAGGPGSPGAGKSTNGAGTYITFQLPFAVHLEPATVYGFDLGVAGRSDNHFEWLGTRADVYAGGTAYQRTGQTLKLLEGDRVFHLRLDTPTKPNRLVHPGSLHTKADLQRMKEKVAAGLEPWKSSFAALEKMPYAQTSWRAAPVETLIRGIPGNNYTRSQEDAAAIYELALRWQISGDTSFADAAVAVANAWSAKLKAVSGNSNLSLGAGIVGCQFACGAELLSDYPGWAPSDRQRFKDMMMRVYYPANFDFLWRHHDTVFVEGGSTHYRLNWDTCNMASMIAIGVLCDNRAVYEQAIDCFKYGTGNGRIERAIWYTHPNGLGQTEEMGRDQGHDIGGMDFLARMCQIAWNQGDDLYGYDNNRVLRGLEYVAKYNLGEDVPYLPYRNSALKYSEMTPSAANRGSLGPMYEMVYNHYVNAMGIDAPYSRLVAQRMRPQGGPSRQAHPSQLDWFGFGSLTFTRDQVAPPAAPSGLQAQWSNGKITLNWWGSAGATGYDIRRSTAANGAYVSIGSAGAKDTFFTDSNVAEGNAYYYIVCANLPDGRRLTSPPLEVRQSLVAHYAFDGDANDIAGGRAATVVTGPSGSPSYAPGRIGKAIRLDGVADHVQLPAGIASYQDITLAAWVCWDGGNSFQRIFDFGTEIDKCMFLTPKAGNGRLQFVITTTRSTEGTGTLEGPSLPTGQWTHVAVTMRGDTGTLYVNGQPVDSRKIEISPLFGQPFCYLGRSIYNTDPFFKGLLDDFRIYNHALDAKSVRALAMMPQ